MTELLTPSEVEAQAKDAGLSIADFCRKAEISPSIFSRWKHGNTAPNMASYQKIAGTLAGLKAANVA